MEKLPHFYKVSAECDGSETPVTVTSGASNALLSGAPKQFGGSGEHWSPEDFFVAAVADCFVLTFKAIARGKKLPWHSVKCEATGTLDRVDGKTMFTTIDIRCSLVIEGDEIEKARDILQQSEQQCLVTNSIASKINFEILEVSKY